MLFAGPASAASDYLLEIDAIKGETTATSPAGSIEVSSFSWGASQASVAPRDAASGMTTGKRQYKPMNAVSGEERVATVATPAADSIKTFSLTVAEPGDQTAAYLVRMCASGKHIANAVLTSRTERFELTDIMITSCAVTGNQRKHEFTGHVTLMK
jgi:type VI protein secretion system component Hcp